MTKQASCVVALLLAACVSNNHSNQNRLVLAYRFEPATLDPLFLPGRLNQDITALLYSTLLHEGTDGVFTPEIAASVPTQHNGGISRDGLRIRFRLRPDVRWSDGTRLTADDVAFTFAAIVNPANNIELTQDYDAIESVTAVNRYTVMVKLKQRYAPILESLNYAILPRHVLRNARSLNNQTFDSHPIGSGPYQLKRWSRDDRLELVANPYYYAGRARIDEIDLESVPNDTTALSLMRAGTIDGSFGIDSAILPEVRSLSNYRVLSGSLSNMRALMFNVRDPILQDARIRRAFAAAVDIPSVVRRATRDAFDVRDAAEPAFRWSYDPSARYSEYNLPRAEALLDAAGWHRAANGQRFRNGKNLSVELAFMTGQPSIEEVVTQLQAQLAAAGIGATLHGFSPTVFFTAGPIGEPRSQAVYLAWLEPPDPDQSFMINCNMFQPHGGNSMFYCNKSVDAANRAALDTYDRSKRAALYRIVQHILARDLPFIPVYAGHDFDVIANRVRVPDLRRQIDPFESVAGWRIR